VTQPSLDYARQALHPRLANVSIYPCNQQVYKPLHLHSKPQQHSSLPNAPKWEVSNHYLLDTKIPNPPYPSLSLYTFTVRQKIGCRWGRGSDKLPSLLSFPLHYYCHYHSHSPPPRSTNHAAALPPPESSNTPSQPLQSPNDRNKSRPILSQIQASKPRKPTHELQKQSFCVLLYPLTADAELIYPSAFPPSMIHNFTPPSFRSQPHPASTTSTSVCMKR
jgi:hypothetical protein